MASLGESWAFCGYCNPCATRVRPEPEVFLLCLAMGDLGDGRHALLDLRFANKNCWLAKSSPELASLLDSLVSSFLQPGTTTGLCTTKTCRRSRQNTTKYFIQLLDPLEAFLGTNRGTKSYIAGMKGRNGLLMHPASLVGR